MSVRALSLALPIILVACASPTEPPVAARLAIGTAPSGATSGLALNVQPVVRVVSDDGKLATGADVPVTAALVSGSGTLAGTTTVTAANGVATFTDLRIDGPGLHEIHFTSAGLDAVTAPGLNVTQVAASLVVERSPEGTYSGHEFEIQPRVDILDHAGIQLATGPVNVVVTKASGAGTLTGTLNTSATAGRATFANLRISGAGPHVLRFSLQGGTAAFVESAAFEVQPTLLAKDLGVGTQHACALSLGGRVYCWGFNQYARAGQPPATTELPVPRRILGNNVFTAIAVGDNHGCGIATDGRAYCWGTQEYNQLGSAIAGPVSTPTAIAGTTTFTELVAGWVHTCARTDAGVVHCWGQNEAGQLGDGSTAPRVGPAPVSGTTVFASIAGGLNGTCGLSSGALWCWGAGAAPAVPPVDNTPQLEVGGLTLAAVAVGYDHKCGLVQSDGWYCWGENSRSQFGDGTGAGSSTPQRISELTPFVEIDYGFDRGCGRTSGGAAYCWGANLYGQIGDGTTTPRPTPTAVLGGLTFAKVRVGFMMTCGLTTGNAIYCWGSNGAYELGDGTTTERHVPTLVGNP